MSAHDVDGPNAGYARLLLEDYLEDPDAVPPEWRELFESGDSDLVASHPGLLRLLEKLERDNGANGRSAELAAPAPPAPAPAAEAPAPAARSTRRCSAPSQRRWRSSRRIACTATSPPGSIRSAPSRSATRRSTRRG